MPARKETYFPSSSLEGIRNLFDGILTFAPCWAAAPSVRFSEVAFATLSDHSSGTVADFHRLPIGLNALFCLIYYNLNDPDMSSNKRNNASFRHYFGSKGGAEF